MSRYRRVKRQDQGPPEDIQAIDQLCATICWLVEQVAARESMTLSATCQYLAVRAPTRYMSQALETAERVFRSRGL